MQRFILLFALLGIITSQKPVIIISGTIYDSSGDVLPGATVNEKETTNGTVTDVDGFYSITVSSESSILEYSFIGYLTKEVTVGSRRQIDVVLEMDVQSLDEIVVTGYSTTEMKSVTGSVSSTKRSKPRAEAEVRSRLNATGAVSRAISVPMDSYDYAPPQWQGEDYEGVEENKFLQTYRQAAIYFFDRCRCCLLQQHAPLSQ